jgi:hypothetical protein
MSDFPTPQSDGEQVHLSHLSPQTHDALVESARRNDCTVDEQAEQILKTHLASCGDDDR